MIDTTGIATWGFWDSDMTQYSMRVATWGYFGAANPTPPVFFIAGSEPWLSVGSQHKLRGH